MTADELRIIEWGTPPPRSPNGQRVDVSAVVEALKGRPGSWALVFVSTSWSPVGRRKRMLLEAGCEVESIGGSGGEHHLWARWPVAS